MLAQGYRRIGLMIVALTLVMNLSTCTNMFNFVFGIGDGRGRQGPHVGVDVFQCAPQLRGYLWCCALGQ